MDIDLKSIPKIAFDWHSESKRMETRGPDCKCLHSNGPYKSAYGEFDLIPGGIYCWEIEAIRGTNFKIGIVKKKEGLLYDKAFSDEIDGFAYYSYGQLRNGLNMPNNTTKEYGKSYGNKDIVGVYFDATKGYLAYF